MCDGQSCGDFGCPKCVESILDRKHGWVECKSTSFPGKVYYFHTVTGCSTWQRPVPRSTQLPRYKKWYSGSSKNDKILSEFMVSETEGTILGSDATLSNFEMHARRMEIYLKNNADYDRLATKYGGSDLLHDKLLICYKNAKSELAKQLNPQKKIQKKKPLKLLSVKSKTKAIIPVKTIRECHGIKTISYDPLPRQLPIDIKIPDLSETSNDNKPAAGFERSNICDGKILRGQGYNDAIADHDQNFVQSFAFNDINLSKSDTTASGIGSV